MAQNLATSGLLKLPAEVRIRIWEFAFGYNTVHVYRETTIPTPCNSLVANETSGIKKTRTETYSIGGLLSCRLIYAEACLIPYAHNIFIWDGDHYGFTRHFLERRRPIQLRALRIVGGAHVFWAGVRQSDQLKAITTVFVVNQPDVYTEAWFRKQVMAPNKDFQLVQIDRSDLEAGDSLCDSR